MNQDDRVPATLLAQDNHPVSTGLASFDTTQFVGAFWPGGASPRDIDPLSVAAVKTEHGIRRLVYFHICPAEHQIQKHYHFRFEPYA